jgi:DNA-binding response OmpR family regulator
MGFALGAADFMTKPIDLDRLVALLRRYPCEHPPCPILVVEDDPATRERFRRTLEKEGWRVIEAATGRDALHVLRRTAGTDHPRSDAARDGRLRVAEELRRNPSWHSIPIVVVTAKDLTDRTANGSTAMSSAFLQKGAHTRDELVTEIREVVRPFEKGAGEADNEGAEHMNRVLAALVLVAMAASPLAAQSPPAQPSTPDVRLFEDADVRLRVRRRWKSRCRRRQGRSR